MQVVAENTPWLALTFQEWRSCQCNLYGVRVRIEQIGYTLKIIREDIETSYKEKLEEISHSLENLVQKKDVKKDDIIEHPNYVKEILRYNITDVSSRLLCMNS